MPLYEYRCTGCGEQVEVLQHIGDAPLSVCGGCGGRMEKLLSAPALQFRGSGWYVTDYARKGNGNGSSSPAEGDAKPEKSAAPANAPAASESAKPAESAATPAATPAAT